ncbi:hypothetical protein Tco_1475295 [Tanacetum coccineum]
MQNKHIKNTNHALMAVFTVNNETELESKKAKDIEIRMAREATLKNQRVIHANVRQASPAWTNINRVNKANQFTPRPVNIRPNLSTATKSIKTSRVNVNTGHEKVNIPGNTTYKSNIYAVKGKMGTAVKTSAGYVWRKITPHSNTNSGSTPDSYVHVSQGTSTEAKEHRVILIVDVSWALDWGFQGAHRPLLPSMLLVATNPSAGQEHAAQAQTQPTPPPFPSTTPTPIPTSPPPPPPPSIPSPTPPTIPTPTSPSPPPPETEPSIEHIYEEQSPVHHHFSPSQVQDPSHMPTDALL